MPSALIRTLAAAAALSLLSGPARSQDLTVEIDRRAQRLESQLIAWRRDIHQHPELGNREQRTAELVASHLRGLGLEVRTGVAGHGVVAILRGAKPGGVVALRADMDALPLQEMTGLPFASQATADYRGTIQPIMHACGHDAHVAILMTTAQVLTEMKQDLAGTVVFLFQPAEETPADFTPDGTKFWGARQMIAEGMLDAPRVDAIFALHVIAGIPSGHVHWRSGPMASSADLLQIKVKGRGAHGSSPWRGVDPIVLSAQVVMGLQTIQSRQVDVTKEPLMVTLGQIHGGTRENIIPDQVYMDGTIRSYDRDIQLDVHRRIKSTSELIAQSGGGSAEVKIIELFGAVINDTELTKSMDATLKRVAGPGRWNDSPPKRTGSEDFSFYQEKVPGVYVHLGVTPPDQVATAASNHSPQFMIDETALLQGVRVMSNLAVDFLESKRERPQ